MAKKSATKTSSTDTQDKSLINNDTDTTTQVPVSQEGEALDKQQNMLDTAVTPGDDAANTATDIGEPRDEDAAREKAEQDALDIMKGRADKAGVEYGANIGIETLTERVEEAEAKNLEDMKERADKVGVEYAGNIGIDTLTARVETAEAEQEDREDDDDAPKELTGAEALAISNDY